MKIFLEGLGKRYLRHSIFRNLSASLSAPQRVALLGANGSGKSTLLRIIAGMQAPSAGKVRFETGGSNLAPEAVFRHLSFCAPGMDVPDELTLRELIHFHFSFKKLLPGLSPASLPGLMQLDGFADRQVGDFSSGMKQRAKLGLAFFSQSQALLLDEPCSNFDLAGIELYRHWMRQYAGDRLVIVASNDEREYDFCELRIAVEDYR